MSISVPSAARSQPLDRVQRDFEAVLSELPDAAVPRSVRRRAAEQLLKLGWPSTRDEQWRYANLRAFERVASFLPPLAPAPGTASEAGTQATDFAASAAASVAASALSAVQLPPCLPGFERQIFLDGVRTPAAPSPTGTVAFASRSLEAAWLPEQRLGLLCDMFATDEALLRVSGEAAIELVFVSTERAAGAAVYPRLQLELLPDSRLTLIERHLGAPAATTLLCANVSVELARGALLEHYRLQQCGAHMLYNDTLTARVQQDASYRVRQIMIGAGSARSSARVRLAGAGAALSWQAIAVGRAEQVHDMVLKVEHAAPATRTEEVYRGIADERARVAFSGHILIESAAPGAEARQSLRGLIEGANAEVDLRPRLEINTDEVSAQHGATTGRLDENLLFYLLSRGIEPKLARTLLKWAFLGDVLRQIELPSLRAEAERSAAGQLQDVLAVGGIV